MTAQIEDVIVSQVERHEDERGFFSEITRFGDLTATFAQINHSHSRARSLRGLHFHKKQSDLWYVVKGRAQIALVDIRTPAPVVDTFILEDDGPATIYIPPGVAHGYLALTDVDLFYAVTHEFDSSDEYGIAWDDPRLQIPWEISDPILSDRDRANPTFGEL